MQATPVPASQPVTPDDPPAFLAAPVSAQPPPPAPAQAPAQSAPGSGTGLPSLRQQIANQGSAYDQLAAAQVQGTQAVHDANAAGMSLQDQLRARAMGRSDDIARHSLQQSQELSGIAKDQAQLDSEAAKATENPRGYEDSRGTFGTIRDVLGGILGGALQGLQGGSNQYLDLIGKRIDRDIAAQRTAITQKKDAATAHRSLYGMALQRFGNENAAEAATHAAYLEGAEADLRKQAIASNDADVIRRGFEAAAQINLQKQEWQARLVAQQQAAAGAAAAAKAAQAERDREFGLKEYEAQTKRLEANGKGGEQAQKYANAVDNAKLPDLATRIQRAEAAVNDGGGLGSVVGRLPDWTPGISQHDIVNRGDVKALTLELTHELTRLNPADAALVQEAANRNPSIENIRHMVDVAKSLYTNKMAAIGGGFPDAVKQQYAAQGGFAPTLVPMPALPPGAVRR